MLTFYRDFPLQYQAEYQRFLQMVEQNHNVLYHCTAGKDGTGFTSLLLLSALGIDRSTIIADYLESNRNNPTSDRHLQEQIKKFGISDKMLLPLLVVEAAYLDAAQQVID